jgi:NADP-dependent 3-hydroxy acid dehydrogenase YdfG
VSAGSAGEEAVLERLDGTVALVTGASSGFGEAIARALAAHGATVALVARRKDRLERLASEIEQRAATAIAIEADISQRAEAVGAVRTTVDQFARLDTVVNNAGVMFVDPVEDALVDEWDRMLAVNVTGLLNVAHAALPHLLQAAELGPRRVADMVNISSVAGIKTGAGVGVYSLTKYGVGAFSEALRQEVAGRHVRVSVIEPGSANTELRSHMRATAQARGHARASVERLEPEDIAHAVTYVVTRPRRIAVNEVVIRPTEQKE